MSLIPAPKEVVAMGKIELDNHTGEPIFPEKATEEQIAAYWKWRECVKMARENTVKIVEDERTREQRKRLAGRALEYLMFLDDDE